MRRYWIVLFALLAMTLSTTACGDEDENNGNNNSNNVADAGDVQEDVGDDTEADTEPQQLYWADVSAVFEDRNCSGCHATIPNSYQSVVDEWIEGPDGNVLEDKMRINHRVNAADAQIVLDWIDQGYPEE